MFNKKKCKNCKYSLRTNGAGLPSFACNYSAFNGTCLKRAGDKVIDLRGDDPNNCKLYEKGSPERQITQIRY